MRNVGYADDAILTADGCVSEIGQFEGYSCCPADICQLEACGLMCSFIELLPNGPLWDRQKSAGMDRYAAGWCTPVCPPGTPACASLVDYAAYSGYRLYSLIQGPLWSAIRESNPYTAVETLDDWLSLYGWTNEWETVCRDPRLGPSPLDCPGDQALGACDTNFQPVVIPQIPPALDLAVKRGVAIALKRLKMRPIKNLCGINWVIEPLGAAVRPPEVIPEHTCADALQWEICNTGDTIESAPGLNCSKMSTRQIPASFEMNSLVFDTATGVCRPTGPDKIRIWPAVMAAQIIALSMLPEKYCRNPLVRCAPLN